MEPFLTLGVGYLIFRGLGAVLDDIDGRQQEKQAPRHTPLYTPPPAAPKKPPSYSLPVIDARKPTAPAYSNARELFRKEYVSFTRLDTFAKCRRKFSLVYLNGYRQESRDASSAARHGNRFHGMCEELFRRNEGKKIGHLIHEPEVQKDSRIRQIIESQHPDSIILAEELELSFRADDREFLGYVDLAVECPDGMVCLVDFKTGRQFKPPDPIQLDIYSVPELLLRPTRQVHLCFVLVDKGEVIKWSNGPQNRDDVFARLRKRIHEVESEAEFSANRGPLCNYCHVRRTCEISERSIYKQYAKRRSR